MKESETLVLTKGQTFWHYSIVPLLLIAPILATIDIFKYYVTHTYSGVRQIEELIVFGYVWILPALAFYFIQKQRLKFKLINVSVDSDIFKKTVQQTATELEWKIKNETFDTIIAKSGFSWKSWGEQIIIIWSKDKILFNSICDPDKRPSVTSFGINKLNRKTFELFLKQNAANIGFAKSLAASNPNVS